MHMEMIRYAITLVNPGESRKHLFFMLKDQFGMSIEATEIYEAEMAVLKITDDLEFAGTVVDRINKEGHGMRAKVLRIY